MGYKEDKIKIIISLVIFIILLWLIINPANFCQQFFDSGWDCTYLTYLKTSSYFYAENEYKFYVLEQIILLIPLIYIGILIRRNKINWKLSWMKSISSLIGGAILGFIAFICTPKQDSLHCNAFPDECISFDFLYIFTPLFIISIYLIWSLFQNKKK